ncbi:MAG: hypothetical protein PVH77_01310 [Phycisphaerales bacterium]
MCLYTLAGCVVLVAKWVCSFFFILLYRIMGFHQPSPLYPFKEEAGKIIVNILSNITAVYALVILFDKLQLQLGIAVLAMPLLAGLLWSHYNLTRAKQGIAPSRQIAMVFVRFKQQVENQYGKETAETVAGEELKKRYLTRSEYAYLIGNISGIVLGALIFLRNLPLL